MCFSLLIVSTKYFGYNCQTNDVSKRSWLFSRLGSASLFRRVKVSYERKLSLESDLKWSTFEATSLFAREYLCPARCSLLLKSAVPIQEIRKQIVQMRKSVLSDDSLHYRATNKRMSRNDARWRF